MRDYILLLYVVAAPLALLALVVLAGRLFRRRVQRGMELSAFGLPFDREEPQKTAIARELPPLKFRRVHWPLMESRKEHLAEDLAAAEATRRAISLAYIVSGVAYSVITTAFFAVAMAERTHYPAYVVAILIYLMQWPPLFILVWFLGTSLRQRAAILGGYLLVGLLLSLLAPSWSGAVRLASILASLTAVLPVMGLLLLLVRRLRPWLVAFVAVLIFLMVGFVVLMITLISVKTDVRQATDIGRARPWVMALGIIFPVIGVLVVGWALRRRSWLLPAAGVACLALAGFLCIRLLPNPMLGVCLLGVPSSVLQVLIVWLLFKMFLHLQERQLLPPMAVQSHICWGFLTLYLVASISFGTAFYGQKWWGPWAVVLGYAVYLGMLHTLLHRVWVKRVSHSGKRLLLLRVFGTADKHEGLLDWLDDTWRFVGRIDLIAGTDLAERTLGSRMLEAFLLRRTDEQFLKTREEVDGRLAKLRSELEGDARYPINTVYCYATAWRQAVERLAPESDAVLMDLRGFTSKNKGCIFELNWVVRRVNLSRVILLVDRSTDYQSLEQVVHTAWLELPSDSPNADQQEPMVTIVDEPARSIFGGWGMFTLLLDAAKPG